MKIVETSITLGELREMAGHFFGNMVKGVVDTEKEIVALDASLHSDLEALLLNEGSSQKNLWGINLYPDLLGDDFVEFDSMINVRPSQKNMSRGVEDETIRRQIRDVVKKRIQV